jgi:two-component system sensor histidine kinase HydH
MPPERRRSSLAAWAAPVAIVLMGVALLVTAWLTYAGVQGATATVSQGEASALRQSVRARLMEAGDKAPALDAALVELAPDGLRYVAVVDEHGQPVASAGRPRSAFPPPPDLHPDDRLRPADDRLRAIYPVALSTRGGGPRRRGLMLLEFVPVRAAQLDRVATRTLGAGVLAVAILLLVAIALVRLALRREAALRELERSRHLASLGEMSAVLAHEIRNPLASLKGNAQLLAAALPVGDKPHAKATLVVDEAIRLERLTRELLTFARTGELHLREIDPRAPLDEAIAELDPGISVDSSAAPRTWPLDPSRVREVLVNLVANAIAAGGPVEARVATDGDALVYTIRDHGPGVPAEDRERVFQPFYTTRTQGTGLGLAVVRRVVELHRGTVRVDPAPDGGAVFSVRLPQGRRA